MTLIEGWTVQIEGNFLMVKCESADFLRAMTELRLKTRDLGDVIVMKDTGGFVFTTPETSSLIENRLQTVNLKFQLPLKSFLR